MSMDRAYRPCWYLVLLEIYNLIKRLDSRRSPSMTGVFLLQFLIFFEWQNGGVNMGDIEFKMHLWIGQQVLSLCGVSRTTVSRLMSAYYQEGWTTSKRSIFWELSERDFQALEVGDITSKLYHEISRKFAQLYLCKIKKILNVLSVISACREHHWLAQARNKMKAVFHPRFPMNYCHWWQAT